MQKHLIAGNVSNFHFPIIALELERGSFGCPDLRSLRSQHPFFHDMYVTAVTPGTVSLSWQFQKLILFHLRVHDQEIP